MKDKKLSLRGILWEIKNIRYNAEKVRALNINIPQDPKDLELFLTMMFDYTDEVIDSLKNVEFALEEKLEEVRE